MRGHFGQFRLFVAESAAAKYRHFQERDMSLGHQLQVVSSVFASTFAAWRGSSVFKQRKTPAERPILFDIEASPYCRLVREACTALQLDIEIRPCPKGGSRFRAEAEHFGGKQQFPLLVDSNSGVVLYESADIVAYLFKAYGRGETPSRYRASNWQKGGSYVATIARGLKGLNAKPSLAPAQPLALWSFESSPYSRLVRERLCELELPYTLYNLGKEQWADVGPATRRVKSGPYVPMVGGKREAFLKQYGRVQVPYLEDPNTGAALFESEDILAYLDRTYAR